MFYRLLSPRFCLHAFVPAFRVAIFPAPAFLPLRSAPSHRLSQSPPLPCISVSSLSRPRLFLSCLIFPVPGCSPRLVFSSPVFPSSSCFPPILIPFPDFAAFTFRSHSISVPDAAYLRATLFPGLPPSYFCLGLSLFPAVPVACLFPFRIFLPAAVVFPFFVTRAPVTAPRASRRRKCRFSPPHKMRTKKYS